MRPDALYAGMRRGAEPRDLGWPSSAGDASSRVRVGGHYRCENVEVRGLDQDGAGGHSSPSPRSAASAASCSCNCPLVQIRVQTLGGSRSIRRSRRKSPTAFDFTVLVDDGYVSKAGVFAWPTTWFVDREGRIQFVQVGASNRLDEEFMWRVEASREGAEPATP